MAAIATRGGVALTGFSVVPLDEEIAWQVRGSLRAPDYHHPAYVDNTASSASCGVCLQRLHRRGDSARKILFTYNPFRLRGRFPAPTPIYIHEDACPVFHGSTLPDSLLDRPVTFEAFGDGQRLISRTSNRSTSLGPEVRRRLADDDVRYVHVRDALSGIFACELVVSSTSPIRPHAGGYAPRKHFRGVNSLIKSPINRDISLLYSG
jgi:hypothetical protein